MAAENAVCAASDAGQATDETRVDLPLGISPDRLIRFAEVLARVLVTRALIEAKGKPANDG